MPVIPTYFVQRCPVCGRSLHVPVRLLGEDAACQHCRATFVARAPSPAHWRQTDCPQRLDNTARERRPMPSAR